MEYGVGSLVTPSHMAIDLGLLEDDMSQYDEGFWFIPDDFVNTIGKHCAGKRTLPMTTTKFDEKMDEKVDKDGASIPKIEFTVEADRDLIKGLYQTTFDAVIGRAVNIDWQGLGWEYELHELMPVLMSAAGTLQRLNLSANKLRGPCVEAVIRAIARIDASIVHRRAPSSAHLHEGQRVHDVPERQQGLHAAEQHRRARR